jgi:cephalosporin hydroxylase
MKLLAYSDRKKLLIGGSFGKCDSLLRRTPETTFEYDSSMSDIEEFEQKNRTNIDAMAESSTLNDLSVAWYNEASKYEYSYHFEAFGLPIIQLPQDIQATNEIIWHVRPDLIIETGVARGGSIINSAAQLALLEISDSGRSGGTFNVRESKRKVIGIDIDIRPHNRKAIENHSMGEMVNLIEGSSTDESVLAQVRAMASTAECVLVLLDSNHSHQHVLAELDFYAPLVTRGSYCIVFDTVVQFMPQGSFPDRPWGVGNNPWTAVQEFLMAHPEFEADSPISSRLQISVAPGGYLRRMQ